MVVVVVVMVVRMLSVVDFVNVVFDTNQKSIPQHRNLVHFECANVTTSAEQRKGEDLMEANIIMEYADGT
jgi:site-specific recombinase